MEVEPFKSSTKGINTEEMKKLSHFFLGPSVHPLTTAENLLQIEHQRTVI